MPVIPRDELLEILREVKGKLKEILGDDLVEVILFGSYARGEAREGSDVDVLVITRRKPTPEEDWELGELMTDLVLRYGVVVSLVVYPKREEPKDPFFLTAMEEGIKV